MSESIHAKHARELMEIREAVNATHAAYRSVLAHHKQVTAVVAAMTFVAGMIFGALMGSIQP